MLPAALATLLPARDNPASGGAGRGKGDSATQRHALEEKLADALKDRDFAQADWWKVALARFTERQREFPAGHRLAFAADEIAKREGYLNAPIPFAWLRAPYLHNGSVLSLRALIEPEQRLGKFCRGPQQQYDPQAIGLAAVAPGPGGCPPETPFLFDTTQPGNSNAGHFYPAVGALTPEDREALLAYLGTL